jgi:hypothetical protein
VSVVFLQEKNVEHIEIVVITIKFNLIKQFIFDSILKQIYSVEVIIFVKASLKLYFMHYNKCKIFITSDIVNYKSCY